jgi:FlaA1/EpsC-like NDP-sugar epimerase
MLTLQIAARAEQSKRRRAAGAAAQAGRRESRMSPGRGHVACSLRARPSWRAPARIGEENDIVMGFADSSTLVLPSSSANATSRTSRLLHGRAARALQDVVAHHRRLASVVMHLGLAGAAYLFAVALRFDLDVPAEFRPLFFATLPLLLAAKLVGCWVCGLFRGWWRYVSLHDVEDIVRANLVGSTLFLCAMVFVFGLDGFPRSVFLLDLIICTAAMSGVRIVARIVRERAARPAVRRIDTLALIVGAGEAGIQLHEEIERRAGHRVGVVGFVDDDPSKQDTRICGTPVLGTIDDLPQLLAQHDVGEVLIAMPSAPGAVIRRVVQHCTDARVRHRVLPTLGELVEGRVMLTQMREVKVDDLLAREPVRLDVPKVRQLIRDRTVLVTGAAGSIGSELCRQLASQGPARMILFDRHENGMFNLELELRDRFPAVELTPVLGDILLEDQLASVFGAYRPELVFHAAAYKHVPLAERNVLEAVRNNIFGTRNVAQAAIAHGAQEFVLVSTDKAVRPTSVMGVTKRAAELVIHSMPPGRCRFVSVRFGNVLGSSGSVVPLFREQIARGGPVTVTDPNVTRYFMTIPEAAQLILQAAALGEGGETFILEMGQPVRIVDLARQMIRLSGFEPDEDVPIVFTGLRPGEKLEEELVDDSEGIASTYHDRIRVLRRRSGATVAPPSWLGTLEACVRRAEPSAAIRCLQQIVPAYRPSALLLGNPSASAVSPAHARPEPAATTAA